MAIDLLRSMSFFISQEVTRSHWSKNSISTNFQNRLLQFMSLLFADTAKQGCCVGPCHDAEMEKLIITFELLLTIITLLFHLLIMFGINPIAVLSVKCLNMKKRPSFPKAKMTFGNAMFILI